MLLLTAKAPSFAHFPLTSPNRPPCIYLLNLYWLASRFYCTIAPICHMFWILLSRLKNKIFVIGKLMAKTFGFDHNYFVMTRVTFRTPRTCSYKCLQKLQLLPSPVVEAQASRGGLCRVGSPSLHCCFSQYRHSSLTVLQFMSFSCLLQIINKLNIWRYALATYANVYFSC